MAVNALSTAAPAAAPTVSGNSLKKLSADFDSFLTLLTTQLQNQDPLEPMDSSDFTSQLVQFSSVEQEIQSNKNLETMISLLGGSNASAAFNYIGREVTIAGGQGNLVNGEAKWTYEVDPSAASSAITITDENGKAVYTADGKIGAGLQAFIWDGKNKNGDPLPEGLYKLNVSALTSDKRSVNTRVLSTGTVTGVDTTGTQPLLVIGNIKTGLDTIAGVTHTSPNRDASLLNYIGRQVIARSGDRRLEDEATWTYEVDQTAINTSLTITDASGKTVYLADGEPGGGQRSFTWDGTDINGAKSPEGVYTLKVTALGRDDKVLGSRVTLSGAVTGIESVGASSALLVGGVKVRPEDILSVSPSGSSSAAGVASGI